LLLVEWNHSHIAEHHLLAFPNMVRYVISMVVSKFLYFGGGFQAGTETHFIQNKAIISVSLHFVTPLFLLVIENVVLLGFPRFT